MARFFYKKISYIELRRKNKAITKDEKKCLDCNLDEPLQLSVWQHVVVTPLKVPGVHVEEQPYVEPLIKPSAETVVFCKIIINK